MNKTAQSPSASPWLLPRPDPHSGRCLSTTNRLPERRGDTPCSAAHFRCVAPRRFMCFMLGGISWLLAWGHTRRSDGFPRPVVWGEDHRDRLRRARFVFSGASALSGSGGRPWASHTTTACSRLRPRLARPRKLVGGVPDAREVGRVLRALFPKRSAARMMFRERAAAARAEIAGRGITPVDARPTRCARMKRAL